ncbi:pentatricopeptide repeat-containing protein, partial [Tanacetum coccineum]
NHGNFEIGERVAFKLFELDPSDSGIYVMLASMYRESKMFEKALDVRKLMKVRGVDKTPGCSSIEVNGSVYEFIIRDKSHLRHQEINECLVHITKQLEGSEDIDGQFLVVSSS